MTTLAFTVPGVPAPQGSKRYLGNGVLIESSKRVKPWRADIRAAAEAALAAFGASRYAALWDAPLRVHIGFTMPRPRNHYRTGRNAHLLRDAAPTAPAGKPDLDKLTRAVLDALTGIVWADDSRVVELTAVKSYDEGDGAGANIVISEAAL